MGLGVSPKKRKGRGGFTLLEMVIVLLVTMVLAALVFGMIGSGASSYRRTVEGNNAEAEARIAVAYVTTRVRMNDREGGVRLLGRPAGAGTVWGGEDGYHSELYIGEARVFYEDGAIYEEIGGRRALIAFVRGFGVRYAYGPAGVAGLSVKVTYEDVDAGYVEGGRDLEVDIAFRAIH